jgi:hypothetical protein
MQKVKRFFGVMAAGAALATAGVASAEPCGAVLCLSHNDDAPWECKNYVDGYFDIRVYEDHGKHKHVFNPGKTSAKRYAEVLDQCDGARRIDKDRISAKYGMLEWSPFSFHVVKP